MRKLSMMSVACCVVLALLSSTGMAQGRVDHGQNEFASRCASCHGVGGKGDGVLVRHLVKAPSDLTGLARRNGGVFPAQQVWDTIDGRLSTDVGPHGSREMPIWGQIYRSDDVRLPERHARNRISALVDYLARIQEK